MKIDSPPPIEVAAGLVFRDAKLLITKRLAEDHLGGLWEFPGGKREHGESFSACLQRELREELDIEVEVGHLFDTILHEYPGKLVQIQFYVCRWRAREPRALGCQAFAWIGREELANYSFPPADERLLARLSGSDDLWR